MAANTTLWPAPTPLAAGADTAISLLALKGVGVAVSGVRVQNNASVPINLAYDTPAGPGTIQVQSGQLWSDDTPIAVLHVWTQATGLVVNGTAGPGIAVWGIY